MKIAIVGGGLQGIEIVYLAQQAGYEVLLVDKDKSAPALNLVTEYLICNLVEEEGQFLEGVKDVDLIFPATENDAALATLRRICSKIDLPVLFDWQAYQISSSKERSKQFFIENNIPQSKSWPEADFPVIIKPSQASGSEGVYQVDNQQQLTEVLSTLEEPIIEEYLVGPSYSIEVIAIRGQVFPLAVTYLDFDQIFDCKRVIYSGQIEEWLEDELANICTKIAQRLSLEGIMDLEVIVSKEGIKVLEIDARFPSQTPITVFYGTGLNMVEMLVELTVGQYEEVNLTNSERAVIYEHIEVQDNRLTVCGEHIMAEADNLIIKDDFFGATKVLTNYDPEGGEWIATLIFVADSLNEVFRKRNQTLTEIFNQHQLEEFSDPTIFD
ncbi:3-methylornithine--L-lysine ligase PylC [Natroniella sulfidigena]|uniref:3-methylornithine--L-lysine ligase PylC n=1 Tax=Natroniella sulfidigena TaxID=723921 RepID=UPI00200B97CA|nr:3-methylornithine--L-lysine ligase PylC [Natroniella sulfidigena]